MSWSWLRFGWDRHGPCLDLDAQGTLMSTVVWPSMIQQCCSQVCNDVERLLRLFLACCPLSARQTSHSE